MNYEIKKCDNFSMDQIPQGLRVTHKVTNVGGWGGDSGYPRVFGVKVRGLDSLTWYSNLRNLSNQINPRDPNLSNLSPLYLIIKNCNLLSSY